MLTFAIVAVLTIAVFGGSWGVYALLCEKTDARKDGPGVEDTNGGTVEIRHGRYNKRHNNGLYMSRNVIADPDDTATIVARSRWPYGQMLTIGLLIIAAAAGTTVGMIASQS